MVSDTQERRERVIDAVEAICTQPAALSAAASGAVVAAPVTEWKQEVPRQAAADKIVIDRC